MTKLLAAMCWRRGLTSPRAVSAFLRGEGPEADPFSLPDMDRAVARLRAARRSGERVCVYGDYDADGLTATAVLMTVMGKAGLDVFPYIPVRSTEGYGLSGAALERLRRQGTGLVVTVDCGTTAVEEARLARSMGLGLVITDHHETGELLPEADAVVNPRRSGGRPSADPAGVGVALKLAQAFTLDLAGVSRSLFSMTSPEAGACAGLLDLVALGTVTDVVPLLGENRELVRAGLRLLDPPSRPGLRALWRVAGLEGKRATVYHLSYHLGPRLNAAGRLGDAARALDLLLTADAAEAQAIAGELDQANRERQEIAELTYDETVSRIERGEADPEGDRAIVLAGKGWHEGVIGIVASRLAERFHRPVLLIAADDLGGGRGSGRSIPGLDLVGALGECTPWLGRFGGHRMAAGFQVKPGRLEAFGQAFAAVARERLAVEDLRPELAIDGYVSPGLLKYAGEDLVGLLELLEPHGQGNPEPVLALLGVEFTSARRVGAEKTHLKGVVTAGGHELEVIGFGMGEKAEGLRRARGLYDIAFQPVVDEWADRRRLQLKLVDMRPAAAEVRAPMTRAVLEEDSV